MYQTFTGSGRRPRQVNLSGRPTNPFASSSPAGGPQSAVASAQQDRTNRQLQRERLQASSRIQRVWRGHSARRKTFKAWRQIWDDLEEQRPVAPTNGAYSSPEDALRQLRRLLLFYQPKEDARRLAWYGMRQMATASGTASCSDGPWPEAYLRLSRACTEALRSRDWKADPELDRTLLSLLAYTVRRADNLSREDAVSYYETLTSLKDVPADALQTALVAPLQSTTEAYVGLAVLLETPLDLGMLKLLRSAIEPDVLCKSLGVRSDGQSTRSRLWLLGNLIALVDGCNSESYISAVSRLLGSLADDVEFGSAPIDMDNVAFDRDILDKVAIGLPLNIFLHERVTSLIDQESIRNLLTKSAGSRDHDAAQLLAGYALTLLRCFPTRANDIRMWLYLGPTSTDLSNNSLPATRYFWEASRASTLFRTVCQNSRSVLPLLKESAKTAQQKNDWTVVMVFLELYTFLLKIIDDEEFVGSGSGRSNAIPLEEVGELVTFLKNLGFTLYFNASELHSTEDAAGRDTSSTGLGRHFGKTAEPATRAAAAESKSLTLAGLPGLTIDYLKGLTTGLLRAIYERDSRRHFLPANHWLMTDRFDMTAFIPGVVAEEESRHLVQEQDDDDKNEPESDEEYEVPGMLPAGFAQSGGIGNRRASAPGYASLLRSQNARERAQRKASRKRYLESVAPRLEILQNMPFFIPFTTRVEIFRQFVKLDQEKRRNGHVDPDLWRQSMMFAPPPNGMSPRDLLARHHAKIRRKNEFADAFDQFWELGSDLKEPIQITFVDEFDIQEAGIDGGGVTKEFLTSVISQAFDPASENIEHAFFVENDRHLLYPNPTSVEDLKVKLRTMGLRDNQPGSRAEVRNLLQQYEFLGRIIGKCLYEGILIDVNFAGFFLKKWSLTGGANSASMESGYRPNINDLRELDEGLYRGLLALKNAPAEQVEDFGLTFTVDDLVGPDEDHKQVIERELVPGGANKPVTADSQSRLTYINRMSWYRLQGQSAQQTHAFLKGLSSIVQPSWLSMFNQSELQTLIGGAAAEINVVDLRRNTLYGGTYVIGDDGQEHPSIQLFWHVMANLPDAERRKVLKFVTSTPRGPLLGFSQLNPRFSIRDSGSDENRYPTTSTCVNLLKLPMYKSAETLRQKLLAAVNSGAGFDLS